MLPAMQKSVLLDTRTFTRQLLFLNKTTVVLYSLQSPKYMKFDIKHKMNVTVMIIIIIIVYNYCTYINL
jgi:hypothetical protein